MNELKVGKEFGKWYYEKLYGTYDLYDENYTYVDTFRRYSDMRNAIMHDGTIDGIIEYMNYYME